MVNKNWSLDGRVCRVCKVFQTLDHFNIRKNGIPYTLCRPCQAEDQKARARRRLIHVDEVERHCPDCEELKPLGEFPKNSQSKNGYLNICKPCHSTRVSIKKWGISLDGYTHCDVCKEPLERGRNKIAVDHDHSCCPGLGSCGKCVRGVLCARCNIGLGSFRDNPAYLRSAANYLEAYNDSNSMA